MKRRRAFLAILLLSAIPVGVRDASALCMMPGTPCREYARTPVIFQGLVERVAPARTTDRILGEMPGRLFHVRVERAWKGLTSDVSEVDLFTRGEPGKIWVEDEFEFKIGDRTFYPGVGRLEDALPIDLQLGQRLDIGALKLPARLPQVVLHGVVVKQDGQPAADAFVALTNNWRARLQGARTDRNGNFQIAVYPGFSYVMRATAGAGKDALVGEASCSLAGGQLAPALLRIELKRKGEEPNR